MNIILFYRLIVSDFGSGAKDKENKEKVSKQEWCSFFVLNEEIWEPTAFTDQYKRLMNKCAVKTTVLLDRACRQFEITNIDATYNFVILPEIDDTQNNHMVCGCLGDPINIFYVFSVINKWFRW